MSRGTLDLFVFADALGWELVRRHDLLADLFPVRQACRTLLGYSCTFDPTILTGCLPREHGHFSFYAYDPSRSPFSMARGLGWLPENLAGHHRLRNVLSRHLARHLGYTGYFQLYSIPFARLPYFDYTEKRDIYEPGGIIGGQETIFAHWQRSGLPWIRSDWRRDDETNWSQMEQAVTEGKIRLGYLFTAGLDALMHRVGPEEKRVAPAMAAFAQRLSELIRKARQKYDHVRVRVFSDHGMSTVHQVSPMMRLAEAKGWRFGQDYAAAWDSTMARFWFLNDRVRKEIVDWLGSRNEGRILTEEQLQQWGCDFPDHRYGEVFYLLQRGWIFAPSFMNRSLVPGMHGYSPEEPESAACWLSTESEEVAESLRDIHGVMHQAMQAATPT